MSAGSPRARHVDAHRLTDAHTQRIARLFAEGMPAGRIALIARCTRARVLAVAESHGWRLDAAGVLPRPQRPAVVPGRPIGDAGSGLAAARPSVPLAPLPPLPVRAPAPTKVIRRCNPPFCNNQVKSRGLCSKHYMAARRAKAS